MYSKILFCQIILSLLFTSCQKDTSPIGTEPQPDRPTTGDAILTGHMYYDYLENRPAINSKVIVFFYNDYSDTLAVAEIDQEGKYYIDNLPEDTVDLIISQPFYDPILISHKIWDIALKPDTNVVNEEGIYTQSWIDHLELVSDHFMVRFDTTSNQAAIDSFNTYHNILSVKFYTSIRNQDYYFLEIDPARDVLPLIDVYQKSDLTLEAGPVFYDRTRYFWSLGGVGSRIKDWVTLGQVEAFANELNLDLRVSNDWYNFIMTKNTPIIQEQVRMYIYFYPLFISGDLWLDHSFEFGPAPWE